MGYYTRFELEVVSGGDYETDYEEVISEQADYNPFGDETKWYDFEKDMRKVSKENPKVLLKLSGEGEENGDLWEAYFKDGKMQICKAEIVYKNFDETLLQ
jgi:hypothetical protein